MNMQAIADSLEKKAQGPLGLLGRAGGALRGAGAAAMPAIRRFAPTAAVGGLAGLGGAAAAEALRRPDVPPPPVVSMAQLVQQLRPELSWDDALDVAYEGWERFQEGKEASDKSEHTIEKLGIELITELEHSQKILAEHDKVKLAFVLGFKSAMDKKAKKHWKQEVGKAMKEVGAGKAKGKEKAKKVQEALQLADTRYKAKGEKKAEMESVDTLKTATQKISKKLTYKAREKERGEKVSSLMEFWHNLPR